MVVKMVVGPIANLSKLASSGQATLMTDRWASHEPVAWWWYADRPVRGAILRSHGYVLPRSGSGGQCVDARNLCRCQRSVGERACLFSGLCRCPDAAERDRPVRACPDICQRTLDQGAPAGAELFANLSQSLPPPRHAGFGEVVPIWRFPADITGGQLIGGTVFAR
jgi:hypothetical protein